MHGEPRLLHLRYYVLADGSHVGVGGSARNDEVVSHVGDACQIEYYDVVCFHIEAKLAGALYPLRAFAGGYRW